MGPRATPGAGRSVFPQRPGSHTRRRPGPAIHHHHRHRDVDGEVQPLRVQPLRAVPRSTKEDFRGSAAGVQCSTLAYDLGSGPNNEGCYYHSSVNRFTFAVSAFEQCTPEEIAAGPGWGRSGEAHGRVGSKLQASRRGWTASSAHGLEGAPAAFIGLCVRTTRRGPGASPGRGTLRASSSSSWSARVFRAHWLAYGIRAGRGRRDHSWRCCQLPAEHGHGPGGH